MTNDPLPESDDAPVDVEVEHSEHAPEPPPTAPPADGVVVEAEVVTDIAVVDATAAEAEKWAHKGEWKYDWLQYKGDELAIRVPTQNALTALFQAHESCSPEFQMKLTNKFIKNHLSQETIERVLERCVDPDDEEFSSEDAVWMDLLQKVAEIGGKRALKDAEALEAVKN